MQLPIIDRKLENLIKKSNLSEEDLNEILYQALIDHKELYDVEKRIKEMVLSVASIILSEINEKKLQSPIPKDIDIKNNVVAEDKIKETKLDIGMITIDNTVKRSMEEIKEKKKSWVM